MQRRLVIGIVGAAVVGLAGWAWANGGPFVIKYPNGDPAAKGVLARIGTDLKPGREERLRVVKEDLKIMFAADPMYAGRRAPSPRPAPPAKAGAQSVATPGLEAPGLEDQPPLAFVSAIYTIENPTDQEIEVEFGFPILRGIYVSPWSMMPRPDVQVRLDKEGVPSEIISNSIIYGLIRQRAQATIDQALAGDAELSQLVARVRATTYIRQRAREAARAAMSNDAALADAVKQDESLARLMGVESDAADSEREAARAALHAYLTGQLKWAGEPAALMVEYASLDPGTRGIEPPDRRGFVPWLGDSNLQMLAYANLGTMAAIGEQKATQLYAELAAKFDPSVKTAYETIFSAWGGDVRERALDLQTGELRPRELTVDAKTSQETLLTAGMTDPTIYARVDYLNPNAKLTPGEKASCEAVLKHLPVVFTFAPMNLLHYKVKFPAKQTRTLTVSYRQFAYQDTRTPASYQLAYVVHPASMWKEFGPINLEVAVPEAATARASVDCRDIGVETRDWPEDLPRMGPSAEQKSMKLRVYRGEVKDKTGELFVALDAATWRQATAEPVQKVSAAAPAVQPPVR